MNCLPLARLSYKVEIECTNHSYWGSSTEVGRSVNLSWVHVSWDTREPCAASMYQQSLSCSRIFPQLMFATHGCLGHCVSRTGLLTHLVRNSDLCGMLGGWTRAVAFLCRSGASPRGVGAAPLCYLSPGALTRVIGCWKGVVMEKKVSLKLADLSVSFPILGYSFLFVAAAFRSKRYYAFRDTWAFGMAEASLVPDRSWPCDSTVESLSSCQAWSV